ncbi:colicin immunity protein [Rugamonas sp. FT82W]|uniref:Colicin immunity protein n=1 Tax=Duganella vulcania TaxID=2692166 RepID=A0A845G9S6_9BURK|nr:colicin immunity protein [Duganella vulcania]MYM90340.1 colicin immunity protein [Duganella vulcania]
MNTPRDVLFESAADFYLLEGSVWMRLSPTAAVEVCLSAAKNGKVVARIEGGIWHAPGFEARHDCIWDGLDPPISEADAHLNNLSAADFIREEMTMHTAFILTAPPIFGWPHKRIVQIAS